MPRKADPPHTYLYEREGREPVWYIRDGRDYFRSTGCGQGDVEGANRQLADYLRKKWSPKGGGRLDKITVADVICLYLQEVMPTVENQDFIRYTAGPINDLIGKKNLSQINKTTCATYVKMRCAQGVKPVTARHDLKTLRAAINHYHASDYGPLDAVPVVTMPEKPEARLDYFLTRKQVADRIRAARRGRGTKHLARFILIGYYTGTRPGAILRLRWIPSTDGGWFDLESGTLHRKGSRAKRSKKRAPPAKIHTRLMPWLERWRKADIAKGYTYVVHFYGRRVESIDNAWESVAQAAGRVENDGPHILRHTCATWLMQAGVDKYEAAGYLGMSVQTLEDTYCHHHPDFQGNAAKADRKRTATRMPRERVNTRETKRDNETG